MASTRQIRTETEAEMKTEWEQDGQVKVKKEKKTSKNHNRFCCSRLSSHFTEEGNLSYAPALRLTLTIYVPARIMELDGSVEMTLINLIMILIFSFPPSAFVSLVAPPLILSVRSLWYSFAAFCFLTSYVKRYSAASFCLLYCSPLSL